MAPIPVPSDVQIEYLGGAKIEEDAIDGAVVGGLSGITWDEARDVYYLISDDPGHRGPPRFFTMALDLEDPLRPVAEIETMTPLQGLDPADVGIDLEGIALGPEGTLFVSSEGQVAGSPDSPGGRPPFVAEFRRDGTLVRHFGLPDHYTPRPELGTGIRHNLGPEALGVTGDGRLVAGFESSLEQDGAPATARKGSWSRIVEWSLPDGTPFREWIYPVSPLHAEPPVAGAFAVRGLVELVPIDGDTHLALERSFVLGVGATAEIFWVDAKNVEEVTGRAAVGREEVGAAHKRTRLEFREAGAPLDNFEGATLGPWLPDGRRSLIIVSDDNFDREGQASWLLVFAVSGLPPRP